MEKRKHPRLKDYDYSQSGTYFVTVCIDKHRPILSTIVGRGLAPAEVRLSIWGEIVQQELLSLEKRFSNMKVDKYVIMPNHIHVILILRQCGGSKPPPYGFRCNGCMEILKYHSLQKVRV